MMSGFNWSRVSFSTCAMLHPMFIMRQPWKRLTGPRKIKQYIPKGQWLEYGHDARIKVAMIEIRKTQRPPNEKNPWKEQQAIHRPLDGLSEVAPT
mmetsp:Transcript_14171/g.22558  ORF Transcript_14171/g.22558 Transcript_14171/m.22558 type:complete len:95 (-) Transcript_14171:100-384(-)